MHNRTRRLSQTQILILAALGVADCLIIALFGGVVVTQTLRVSQPASTLAQSTPIPPTVAWTATPKPTAALPPTWTPKPAQVQNSRPAAFVYDYCPFDVPPGVEVDCGFIDVPENHHDNSDKAIRLAVAVYHSTSDAPAPDPVLFLSGGPGSGAIAPIAEVYERFIAPILAERDFIVFDQRGTGHSKPLLHCPDYIALPLDQVERNFRADSAALEDYLHEIMSCHDWLVARGFDVAAYTSAASAADIKAIVDVLGYAQVNLYGGSYGTRLAQTVMRDFPGIVRSAVLDSAVPIELKLYNVQAAKMSYALNVLFSRCAADDVCRTAYPNLQDQYNDLVVQMDEDPIIVRAMDPKTGFPFYVRVDGVELTALIFYGLQRTEFIPYLPRLIHDIANDDYTLVSDMLSVPLDSEDVISIGMFLSVNCHEEIFATTPEDIEADYALYPETEEFARAGMMGSAALYYDLCERWGAAPFDPREGEALKSDIPTLIIAGEFDSATPPSFGQQLVDNLSQSYFYIFPGYGHVASVNTGGCALDIARSFLLDPSTAPDTTCLDEMTGPDFVLVE